MGVEYKLEECPKCSGKLEYNRRVGHTILKCDYCGFRSVRTITEKKGERLAKLPAYPTPAVEFTGERLATVYSQLKGVEERSKKVKGIHSYKEIDELSQLLLDAWNTVIHVRREESQISPIPELKYDILKMSTDFGRASNPAYKNTEREIYLNRALARLREAMNIARAHRKKPSELKKPVMWAIIIFIAISLIGTLFVRTDTGMFTIGGNYQVISLVLSIMVAIFLLIMFRKRV